MTEVRQAAKPVSKASEPPGGSGPRILALIQSDQNVQAASYALGVMMQAAGACVETCSYVPSEEIRAAGHDAVVSYGEVAPRVTGQAHVHIGACGLFAGDQYLKRSSLPKERVDRDGLSVLYTADVGKQCAPQRAEGRAVLVTMDLVASAFVLLTCYPEIIHSGLIDKRGRRVAEESILLRFEILDRPLVNEYSAFLASQLEELDPRIRFPERSWRSANYALALTRDIDSLRKYDGLSVRRLAALTARGDAAGVVRSVSNGISAKLRPAADPYNNIKAITDWEAGLGIRSSLYVMASDLIGDANYRIEDLAEKWDLEGLSARGWEIGFHPGYLTYSSENVFLTEKARLTSAVRLPLAGGRQHGLRFLPPFTWRHWEDSNFRYDSSLGFAEHEGFRCGICLPFRPFDLFENRVLDLWEIPLTVMDCSLDSYRKMDAARCRKILRELLGQVKRHRGVFVLLWHNNYFGRENSGWLHDELAGLVQNAVADGALVGPARDILDAWEERAID